MFDSLGSSLFCGAVLALPFLVILVVWVFFRSAVRSGVETAKPGALPPPAAGLTEAQVRQIVRDEIQRLRSARAGAGPSQASPRS
jgi:hypothetical protein